MAGFNFDNRFDQHELNQGSQGDLYTLQEKTDLLQFFDNVHKRMISGEPFKDILDSFFDSLKGLIPFDRISIALLDDKKETITLEWVKSNMPINSLNENFSAPLKETSLGEIISSESPRVINDLKEYYLDHPNSKYTKLALEDKILSSLTFPLYLYGNPFGIIFFSSGKRCTYTLQHVEIFSEIAAEFSLVIEQGISRKKISEYGQREEVFRDTIHNLNNPLQIIQGTLTLMQRKEWYHLLNDDSLRSFKTLKRNCDSMIQLVRHITYATPVANEGKNELPARINLKVFLEDIIIDAKMMADRKNIEIISDFNNLSDSELLVNKEKIKLVIDNLVSNAIKYSPCSSEITMSANIEQLQRLRITVKDNGPGIPKEDLNKLFRPLGITRVIPTEEEPSKGLGLASVKKIVNSLNGEVFVDSIEGKGSSFGFWIPYLQ